MSFESKKNAQRAQLTKFDQKNNWQIKLSLLMPIRVNLVTFRTIIVSCTTVTMQCFKTYPNLSNKNYISMQNLPQILLDQEIPHLPVPGVCIFRNSSQNNRNNSSLRFQKKRGIKFIFIQKILLIYYQNICNVCQSGQHCGASR